MDYGLEQAALVKHHIVCDAHLEGRRADTLLSVQLQASCVCLLPER